MDACERFRSEWLEHVLDEAVRATLEAPGSHAASCGACAEWLKARRFQVELLGALERRTLPGTLDEAIAADLAGAGDGVNASVEEALRDLPRQSAPAELDALVGADLARLARPQDVERDPAANVKTLSVLDFPQVPAVLDRIVDEELARPGLHRAERFVGNLERVPAPAELDGRVAGLFRTRRIPRLAGVATLAAAALVVWLSGGTSEPAAAPRRLQVVYVDAAEASLSPFAQGLAASLAGGVAPASRASVSEPSGSMEEER